MIGCNPQDLRTLADLIDRGRREMDGGITDAGTALRHLDWQGDDADAARAAWRSDIESASHRVDDELRRLSDLLRRNAETQELVSASLAGAFAAGSVELTGPGLARDQLQTDHLWRGYLDDWEIVRLDVGGEIGGHFKIFDLGLGARGSLVMTGDPEFPYKVELSGGPYAGVLFKSLSGGNKAGATAVFQFRTEEEAYAFIKGLLGSAVPDGVGEWLAMASPVIGGAQRLQDMGNFLKQHNDSLSSLTMSVDGVRKVELEGMGHRFSVEGALGGSYDLITNEASVRTSLSAGGAVNLGGLTMRAGSDIGAEFTVDPEGNALKLVLSGEGQFGLGPGMMSEFSNADYTAGLHGRFSAEIDLADPRTRDAAIDLFKHGPNSPEGRAAMSRLVDQAAVTIQAGPAFSASGGGSAEKGPVGVRGSVHADTTIHPYFLVKPPHEKYRVFP